VEAVHIAVVEEVVGIGRVVAVRIASVVVDPVGRIAPGVARIDPVEVELAAHRQPAAVAVGIGCDFA